LKLHIGDVPGAEPFAQNIPFTSATMTCLSSTSRLSVILPALLFLLLNFAVPDVAAKRVHRRQAWDSSHSISPKHLSGPSFFESASSLDGSAVGVRDMEVRAVSP